MFECFFCFCFSVCVFQLFFFFFLGGGGGCCLVFVLLFVCCNVYVLFFGVLGVCCRGVAFVMFFISWVTLRGSHVDAMLGVL